MSRTRRFTGAAIAVATLSALALAGCSSGSGSPSAGGSAGPSGNVTWTSWGDAGEIAIMKQFTSDFNKSHPNIKVTFQPGADYSSYHPKLLTQLSANKAPDVFYIGDDNIGSFVSANVLEPLDSYLAEPSSAVSQSDFYPGLFGAAQQGTTIFGIPNDSNPDAFWYDKTALQKAGITQDPATLAANDQWTLATFLDMCQKLHAAGLMGAGFWNYWSTTYSWLSVNDAPAWDGDTFAAATNDTSKAALAQLGDAFQKGYFTVLDTLPDSPGSDSLFVTHKLGFYVQGRYTIQAIEQGGGDKSNYDVVRWPTIDGKARPTGVAVSYLVMNKNSSNKDAAWEFMSAYLSVQGQEARLSNAGNAVPSVKGADQVVLNGYPAHAQDLLDMRNTGFEDYSGDGTPPGLSSDISAAMLNLYQGKADIDQTIAAIQAAIAKDTKK